jgi:UDP-N-acetylenolpyruvoylglucosamine reductase
MASTLALRGVPAARRADGPASCGARAPRATAGGVRGSARPRLAHAPWHSPTPPPRASTRARAFAVDRGEALGDDDDALAELFVDATRGRSRRALAGDDDNERVAHERDHDVEKHLTHILASLSSREEDEDATRRDVHHGKASPRPARAARVFKNASLGKYCTLGLGGSARVVVEAYTIEQLVSTLRLCASRGVSSVVVGKGSNVLFADAGFDGVAIVNRVAFVEEAADDERQTDASVQTSTSEPTSTRLFRVGSGTPFNALGASLSRRSWSGLEFAAGVPGTAGGAAFMNAGADGQDTASVMTGVELVSPCGRFRAVAEISSDSADSETETTDSETKTDATKKSIQKSIRRFAIRKDAFGYRRSPFMDDERHEQQLDGRSLSDDDDALTLTSRANTMTNAKTNADEDETYETRGPAGWIVLAVTFRLTRDARAASRARAFASRRRESQPLAERSVGCLFRNPGEGENSAGAAIDRAGLKNHAVGTARVSSRHANFLVVDRERENAAGSGSGFGGTRDMEALIAEVKARVLESTGLVLEEEVRRVPFRTAAPTTARRRRPLRVTRSDSKRAFRRMNEPEPNYDDAKKKTSGGDSRTGPR